jgi:HlyD family secretion protein
MSAASHSVPAPVKQPPSLAPAPVPVRPAPSRPWKWLVLLAVIAVGAYAAYRFLNANVAPSTPVIAVKTGKVTIGNLERTIRVGGQTSAINFANVTAPAMRGPDSNREMILLRTAVPGSWVKKGTLIAEIDSQAMQDHVDDLSDTILAAEADVRKRKAEQQIEWENLQQTLRVSKSEVDKAQLDYNAGEVRTDIERQLLKLTLDEAQATYKQAQADLELKKAAHASEIKILEYTLIRHTRHRDRHKGDVRAFTMYAPMDGLVVMSQIWRGNEMGQVQAGDRVFPGQGFMKIVNTKTMQVEGTVNQAESSEFRVGQDAIIQLDAFPSLQFHGKVHSIGALAAGGWRQSPYIRNVPIRVKIDGSDAKLIPDLSASADVVIEKAEGKLLVPRSALREENGKTFAYVKAGDQWERREVTRGPENEAQTVALAGLAEGDEVRLN